LRAALYIRVSTFKKSSPDSFQQNPEVQIAPLEQLCRARDWELRTCYSDRSSGANSNRPQYKQLMEDARKGLFDVIVVWSLDRWARSLKELITSIEQLKEQNIDFVCYQQPIDTTTSAGRLMFQIFGAFAEFEREIIRERTKAGLDYARSHGTKSGSPIGRPKVVFRRDYVLEMKAEGKSNRAIARELRVSEATVRRACVNTLPEDFAE
jgi:DNA invertase Pin-like site-specific DNA recombinase